MDYQGLHGTDERIRLDSIPVVQAAYHQALLTLLRGSDELANASDVAKRGQISINAAEVMRWPGT